MEQRLLLLSVTVTGGADMTVTIMKTLGYSATMIQVCFKIAFSVPINGFP